MHVGTILHRCLEPLLQSIHRTRLATLFAAVAACVSGPALSLSDVGRRFGGTIALRHKIKRADRLLGNRGKKGKGSRLNYFTARRSFTSRSALDRARE